MATKTFAYIQSPRVAAIVFVDTLFGSSGTFSAVKNTCLRRLDFKSLQTFLLIHKKAKGMILRIIELLLAGSQKFQN